jgi:hypothetical protein
MCSAVSRNGRRLSMQQIVACKASIADPKARYYDLLLPEGGEEAHSFRHDLPDTSSETGRSVMTEQFLPDYNAGRLVLLSIHVEHDHKCMSTRRRVGVLALSVTSRWRRQQKCQVLTCCSICLSRTMQTKVTTETDCTRKTLRMLRQLTSIPWRLTRSIKKTTHKPDEEQRVETQITERNALKCDSAMYRPYCNSTAYERIFVTFKKKIFNFCHLYSCNITHFINLSRLFVLFLNILLCITVSYRARSHSYLQL